MRVVLYWSDQLLGYDTQLFVCVIRGKMKTSFFWQFVQAECSRHKK